MTGLHNDPEDYALLERIRARRCAPDARTMRFVEEVQEGICTRQPMAAMLEPDRIRKMYPHLDAAEVSELARYLDTVRSAVRPPTPYEGAFHSNVQLMAAQLDEAVVALRRWPDLTRPPLFALLEAGHVNARTVIVPDTGDPVVFVDTELLEFLFLFAKAVAFAAPALPPGPDGMLAFATKPDEVAAHLRRNREPLDRFLDAVLGYAMTGRASSAEAYRVPPATENLYGIIMRSAQTFVLAHEYAHVLANDFDRHHGDVTGVVDGEVRLSLMSLTLESAADLLGLDLTLQVIREVDFTMTYWGVELFLYANEIALKAISLLRTGDERGLRQDESMLHATVNARRSMLPVLLQGRITRGLGKEKGEAAWKQVVSGMHVVQGIVDLLWAQTKPLLVAAHRRGARPSSVWEGN